MKRIWGSVGSATILLAGGALLMPACNHADASIYIQGIVLPPVPTTDGTCTFPQASATEVLQFTGVVDVALATSYQEVVLVGNQILPQENATTDRAETSRVTINKITVHVTDSLDQALGDYSTQVSGFVDVGSSGTNGYGELQAELIGGQAFATLAGLARATPYTPFSAVSTFYFTGTTLGGVTVTTPPFSYPVSVCYGCLVDFSNYLTNGDECDYDSMTPPPIPCFSGEEGFKCVLCSDPICKVDGSGVATADAGP
jgi:hypothetical protein